eukprot:4435011-Prymnesium_polylepis.1
MRRPARVMLASSSVARRLASNRRSVRGTRRTAREAATVQSASQQVDDVTIQPDVVLVFPGDLVQRLTRGRRISRRAGVRRSCVLARLRGRLQRRYM